MQNPAGARYLPDQILASQFDKNNEVLLIVHDCSFFQAQSIKLYSTRPTVQQAVIR